MTDETMRQVMLALITNFPAIITAIAAGCVLWFQKRNADRANTKLEEIHTATNGNLSEVKAVKTAIEKDLSVAQERIKGLEDALAVSKAAAAIPPKEG